MDIAKPKRKWGLGIVSAVLSVVLVVGLMPGFTSTALAADDDEGGVFTAPTEAKEAGTYVTVAAHAAAESTPMYLGLDLTTFRSSSFDANITYDNAVKTPRLGIFGSEWNENADTYWWNLFYNTYAEVEGLTKTNEIPLYDGIAGGPNGADGGGTTVSTRSDILCGISSTNLTSSYEGQIAALPENNNDDPSDDYDPYLVAYNDASTYAGGNILNEYSLAKAAVKVMEETGKTSRYDNGDVMTTAKHYEEMALSTQYYILSQIASGATDRKTFVYIEGVDTDTNMFTVSLSSADSAGAADAGRMMEAIQNCATNVTNEMEDELEKGVGNRGDTYYYMTPAQLAEANPDVIICGGNIMAAGGSDHTDAPDNTAMYEQIQLVLSEAQVTVDSAFYINTCNAVNVYGSNGSENVMYVPSCLGFIYDDVVDQMDLMAWWYKNIYHVKDEYVQPAINIVCEKMTTVDGLTVTDGYDTRVSEKFAEGEAYYEANKDTLVGTYPNLISYDDYMADIATTITADNTSVGELTASKDDEGNYEALAPVVSCDDKTITWNTDYLYKIYDTQGNRVWSLTEPGYYKISIEGIANYVGDIDLLLTVADEDGTVPGELPTYTITYELNGGTNAASNPTTHKFGDAAVALADPTMDEFIFAGWFSDEAMTKQVTEIDAFLSSDITLYAKWEEEVVTDKSALEAAIAEAESIDPSNCTVNTREIFETALQGAKAVDENDEATQDEIDAATADLREAIAGLQTQFLDVTDPSEYYYEPVYNMVAIGAITGYEDGSFGVGDSMTRAQLVTVMWRYCEPDEYATYDEPNSKNTSGLPDVPDGQYYTGAVNWAVANNVVTGNLHEDGTYTFNPDDPMTFDQLAAVVARYALGGVEAAENYPTTALDNGSFTDPEAVEDFARGSMSWAIENDIVTGNNNGDGTYTLDPVSDVPRERATTVLWRAIYEDKF